VKVLKDAGGEDTKANFNMMCDQTMVGFVQNKTQLAESQTSYKELELVCTFAHKDYEQLYEHQVLSQ